MAGVGAGALIHKYLNPNLLAVATLSTATSTASSSMQIYIIGIYKI